VKHLSVAETTVPENLVNSYRGRASMGIRSTLIVVCFAALAADEANATSVLDANYSPVGQPPLL
jgi:hypothetical protein